MKRGPYNLRKSTEDNFWDKVDVRGEYECWPWLASTTVQGQAQFKSFLGGLAVRYAYWLANGDFDLDLNVCHSCDYNWCTNPKHLWLGTQQQNLKDCANKGRHWTQRRLRLTYT